MSVETRNRSRPVGVDEPVDGLDGAAGLAPTQALRAIYAFFYNKKVGLTLILAAGLACLFGVLFPQMPAGVRGDPASVDGWLQSVRPSYGGWTSIMDAVGLFNVFSSPLFLTIMGLLALSITACTTHRIPVLMQTAFHPHTKVTAEFFRRARLNDRFATPLRSGEAVALIKEDAKARRVRVIEDHHGPGANLYTDKWHLAPFGTVIAHTAFVVIMAGFVVSSLTGFRDDQFTLTVGRPAEVGHGTGLVAEAISFSDTYYDNGSPKDYVTDLVLSVDGREVARQDVRVNDPLRYDGVMFHQAYFGIAAVMEIRDASGRLLFNDGVPLEWTTPDGSLSYGVLEVPGRDQELFVIGSASGRTGTGIEPGQMRIEVYPTSLDAPVGAAVLDQSGSVQIDGLTYTFEREQQFTGLLVKRDPGTGIVWLGCLLLIIGTCLTMFFRHHRIWIRVTPEAGGGSLVQLASPDRQDATFTRQFAEVAAGLAGTLAEADALGEADAGGAGERLEPGALEDVAVRADLMAEAGSPELAVIEQGLPEANPMEAGSPETGSPESDPREQRSSDLMEEGDEPNA